MRWPAPLEVLLALNVGVFLLWAFGSARRMMRHFEVSPGSLPRRPWTLLTATVSHSDLYSLIGNLQAGSLCYVPFCSSALFDFTFCRALLGTYQIGSTLHTGQPPGSGIY